MALRCKLQLFKKCLNYSSYKVCANHLTYTQGQSPEPKIREYFYYIDHEGMLFLDDAKMKNFTSCFKDKKFLKFFFNRLKLNDTNKYAEEFPYVSLCGPERNYIRCDDLPIVYTQVLKINGVEKFSYAHAGDLLTVDFEPNKIYMSPTSGRIYHPAPEKYGSIGLIRSKLAIEFSKHFEYEPVGGGQGGDDEASPARFKWNDQTFTLSTEWLKNVTIKTQFI